MKPKKMIQMRKQSCPVCHILLNAASHLTGDYSPEPGDLTICATCRTVLVFGDVMDLLLAPQEEIDKIQNELGAVMENIRQSSYSLLDTPDGPGLLCHQCGYSSSNPHDVENRYCGHCHTFLNDL